MSITTVSWRIPFEMEMQHHKEWNIQKQNRQMKLHLWIVNRYHPKSPKQRSLQLRCLWFFHLPHHQMRIRSFTPAVHPRCETPRQPAGKTQGTAAMCEDRPLVFFQPWKPEIETSDTMENRSYLRLLFQVTCLSYWTSRILMKAYESELEKFQCPSHVTFLQMPTKYNQNRNLQIHIPRPQILSVTSCCMLLGEHKAGRASNLKETGPNWTPIVTI